MANQRRYLVVLEVETDIELDRSDPPESSPRWRLLDVYANTNSDSLDAESNYTLDLVDICSIKDMGEVTD